MNVRQEPIKQAADFQANWPAVIPSLRKGRYLVESPESRSIHGDAPKSIIKIREFIPGHANSKRQRWPEYIAKVGSKRYPVESITEHFLTRVGESLGICIAESKLMIVAGQVRFLSKFFLKLPKESLVHGLEIFRRHLDEELVKAIEDTRREREFYTFQTVLAAMADSFGEQANHLMIGLVKMLGFDAVAGNNDRHPLNWGVIVPVSLSRPVRFAPVFDSARGLYWNQDEKNLPKFCESEASREAYIRKSFPQVGWDGVDRIDHFRLIHEIWRAYPEYREPLESLGESAAIDRCATILEEEFKHLMTPTRRYAISTCLKRRHELYRQALA